MTSEENAKAQASKILGSSKETEFLQSFVRVDLGNDDEKDTSSRHKKNTEKQISFDLAEDRDTKERSSPPRQGSPTKPTSGKSIFKQIKKEMTRKGSRRRRVRREEEVYTDKDRAAAANMGCTDIKQSLSMKMRLDRTSALQLPDEADPNTLLALGRNELRAGKIETAINFVNKALELNPEEKSALVARSKCYLLLGEPKLALDDAETALLKDKTYVKAIYQKAEALYYLGDFELSLMFYHRGLRIRPELEGFRLGVQKAQEAIENTIGGTTPLINVKPIATSNLTTPAQTEQEKPKASNVRRAKKTIDPEKKLSRQLLGQLCVDKEYLENLLKHPDLNVADKKSNSIMAHAEEAVQFLNKRQEFWRQQRPTTAAVGKKKSTKINDISPLPKWYGPNN